MVQREMTGAEYWIWSVTLESVELESSIGSEIYRLE